jgi:hypothetical protein
MVVNVRTQDDLRELLRNRASGNWIIGERRVPQITKVRVFNWDNSQVLKGDFDRASCIRDADGRLIIAMRNCRIENFARNENWFQIFGAAVVVYTPNVSIQRLNGAIIGILREINLAGLNQNKINEIFRRLKAEIRLRGLNRIVIRDGNIPIPDFFEEWCGINNVEIEILSEEQMDALYPVQNDQLFDFEVAPNDLHMLYTWYNAIDQQVDGWRLPTIIELQLMHDNLHLNGQGNFVTDNADNNDVYYWSSTVHEDYEDAAWAFNFGNYQGVSMGSAIKASGVPRRVRLVRVY